jgi:drug/metabolite transporter (DMT)-like permease
VPEPDDAPSNRTSGFLLVALAAALWGTDALFRRGLALELPASRVVFWEHVLLTLVVLPVLPRAVRRARALAARDWLALAVVGAGASATATVLFTAAFRFGDPTTPLLLQKLQPLVAVVAAAVLLGERPRPRFGLFFAAAVVGAWLIAFADPGAVAVDSLTAALLATGAATLWALGTVLGRHLLAVLSFAELTALRFAIGLAASAVLVAVEAGPAGFAFPAGDLPALVLLAGVPGLAALLVYYRGLARTPAAAATLAELAFPLSAVTINYVAFGTTLTPTQWLGIVLLAATITTMSLAGTRDQAALGVQTPRRRVATSG